MLPAMGCGFTEGLVQRWTLLLPGDVGTFLSQMSVWTLGRCHGSLLGPRVKPGDIQHAAGSPVQNSSLVWYTLRLKPESSTKY